MSSYATRYWFKSWHGVNNNTIVIIIVGVVSLLCCSSQGSELVNVAVGKPTQQTDDIDTMGLSFKAVDDKTTDMYSKGSCTRTQSDTNMYWIVDLLRTYPIHAISMYNTKFNADRLQDFYIYVSIVNPLPITAFGGFTGQLCLQHADTLSWSGPHDLKCDQVVTGRYIYVWKAANSHLSICEFRVWVKDDDEHFRSYENNFSVFKGRKSATAPFNSTVVPSAKRFSTIACVKMCLTHPAGVATVVQMEAATRTCECVQDSRFTAPNDVVDSGWTLIKSVNN